MGQMNSYRAVLIFTDGMSFQPFRSQDFEASDDDHARSIATRWASADASALYAAIELRLYAGEFLVWFARVRTGVFTGQCANCLGIGEVTPVTDMASGALASALPQPIQCPNCRGTGVHKRSSGYLSPPTEGLFAIASQARHERASGSWSF